MNLPSVISCARDARNPASRQLNCIVLISTYLAVVQMKTRSFSIAPAEENEYTTYGYAEALIERRGPDILVGGFPRSLASAPERFGHLE